MWKMSLISTIFLSLRTPMMAEKHCQADINLQSQESTEHFFPTLFLMELLTNPYHLVLAAG